MRTKIFITLLFLIVGCSAGVSQEGAKAGNETAYVKKTVKTKEVLPLRARLIQASTQLSVPVCLESLRGKQSEADREFALGGGKSITVEDLSQSLEALGYGVRMDANAILVSTPGVRPLATNPLDTRLDGFVFSGTHAGFVEKISKSFPNMPPNVQRIGGAMREDEEYNVSIKGDVSIRDVLMNISSKYGVLWHATIRAKTPVHEIRRADGTVKHVKGSAVTLYFQRVR